VDLRYFMNIRYRGRIVPDHEGDELPVEEAVRDHALATARDLVFGARMDAIRSWFDCSFEVTDQSGRVVLVMPFAAVLGEPDLGSA
jgi:hypothetical protein